jgi:Zn-dependent membrane protease YugP
MIATVSLRGLAHRGGFAHAGQRTRDFSMQRQRARAIAVSHRQERARALLLAAGLLLPMAGLLLLLISP